MTDTDLMIDGSPMDGRHVPGFDCPCVPSREWLDGGDRINHHHPDRPGQWDNCRICDLTYARGTEHRCTDGWASK